MLATIFIVITCVLAAVIWIGWMVWSDDTKTFKKEIEYWKDRAKANADMWRESDIENLKLKDQNLCLSSQNDDLITQLKAKPPLKIDSIVDRKAIKADADFVLNRLNVVIKAVNIADSKLEAFKSKLNKTKPAAKKKPAAKMKK